MIFKIMVDFARWEDKNQRKGKERSGSIKVKYNQNILLSIKIPQTL